MFGSLVRRATVPAVLTLLLGVTAPAAWAAVETFSEEEPAATWATTRSAVFVPQRITAQAKRAVQRSAMVHFTMASSQTRDLRGVEESLYQGDFFRPEIEDIRRCIVKRESEGHYDVVNPGGNYFGAYQVSRDLAEGATWMMLDEHKELLGAEQAKALLAQLRETPFNEWPRYWQDAAFSTVYNWEYTGSGASHWAGGRWSC